MISYEIGDCRNHIPSLEPESIDCLLTDSPYGVNYRSNRSKSTAYKKKFHSGIENDQTPEQALALLEEVLLMCEPKMKKDSDIYLFTRFDIYPQLLDTLPNQFKLKNVLIWDKNAQGMGDIKGNWCNTHEFILYAKKGRRRLNKRSLSVLHYPFHGDFSKTIHPTKKPTDLIKELILNSTQEGNTVLDPFLGSGTTLRACLQTGRNGIGYEINPDYESTIQARCNVGIQTLDAYLK